MGVLDGLDRDLAAINAGTYVDPDIAKKKKAAVDPSLSIGQTLGGLSADFVQGAMDIPKGVSDLGAMVAGNTGFGQDLRDYGQSVTESQAFLEELKPDLYKERANAEVIGRDEEGNVEFNMPSLTQIASQTARSAGPALEVIAGGGAGRKLLQKGLTKGGTKALSKNASKIADTVAYGGANTAVIAPGVYGDTYREVEQALIAQGITDKNEIFARADAAGKKAAAITSPFLFAGGALGQGGVSTKVGQGLAKRVGSGALKEGLTEVPEEVVQSAATDYALSGVDGREVDLVKAANAGALGFAAGAPLGGAAGIAKPAAPVKPKGAMEKAAQPVMDAQAVQQASPLGQIVEPTIEIGDIDPRAKSIRSERLGALQDQLRQEDLTAKAEEQIKTGQGPQSFPEPSYRKAPINPDEEINIQDVKRDTSLLDIGDGKLIEPEITPTEETEIKGQVEKPALEKRKYEQEITGVDSQGDQPKATEEVEQQIKSGEGSKGFSEPSFLHRPYRGSDLRGQLINEKKSKGFKARPQREETNAPSTSEEMDVTNTQDKLVAEDVNIGNVDTKIKELEAVKKVKPELTKVIDTDIKLIKKGNNLEALSTRLKNPKDRLAKRLSNSEKVEAQNVANASNRQKIDTTTSQKIDTTTKAEINEQKNQTQEESSTTQEATQTPKRTGILGQTQAQYIKAQIKDQKIKKASPGFKKAKADITEQYEVEMEKAEVSLPFDEYKTLPSNEGLSEGLLRQSYDGVREEYGITGETVGEFEAIPPTESSVQGETKANTSIAQAGIKAGEFESNKQEHAGYKIYKTNVGGVDKFAVQSQANKQNGKVKGTGNQLFNSLEEAKGEAELSQKKEISKKSAKTKIEAAKLEEQKETEQAQDIDGFKNDTNPLQKSNAAKTLNKNILREGKALKTKDLVKKLLDEGYVPNAKNKNLKHPDGKFVELNKTAIEYAEYLHQNKPQKAKTRTIPPVERRDESKIKSKERRINEAKTKAIEEMSTDERADTINELRSKLKETETLLFTSDITPLPNRRAWNKLKKKKHIISIDVDSLKWVNDNMGHDTGNELLRVVGESLKNAGIDAHHVSGDEFMGHTDDLSSVEGKLSGSITDLSKISIKAELPDGKVLNYTKAGFSYGTGKNTIIAEAGLKTQKSQRKKRGERANRGSEPPGVVRQTAKGKQVDSIDRKKSSGNKGSVEKLSGISDVDASSSSPIISKTIDTKRIKKRTTKRKTKDVALYSKTNTKSGSSAKQIEAWLPRQGKHLLKQGKVIIVQDISQLPASAKVSKNDTGVQGMFHENKIYLVSDNLNKESTTPVLHHEMFHNFIENNPDIKERLLGGHGDLMNAFSDLFDTQYNNKYRPIMSAAMDRVNAADPEGEARMEELGAYIVELYQKSPANIPEKLRKIVGDLIATIKTIAYRAGINVGKLTPADFAALARSGKVGNKKSKVDNNQPKFSIKQTAENINAWFNGAPLTPENKGVLGLPDETRIEKSARLFQDGFNRIKTLQKTLEKQGGVVNDENNVYLAEERSSGITSAKLKYLKENSVEPLVNGMAKKGITLSQLDKFVTATHAEERNKYIASINDAKNMQDGGSGMLTKDAADILGDFEKSGLTAKLQSLADIVYEINDTALNTLLAQGLIDNDTYVQYKGQYNNYVPLKGKEGVDQRGGNGQGYSVQGAGIKAALGRGAGNLSESPVAHSIAQAESAIIRAEKSVVGQTLMKLMRDNPDPDFWTVTEANYKRFTGLDGEVFEGFDNLPEGLVEKQDFHRVKAISSLENKLAKKEGRKPVGKAVYKIDPSYKNRQDVFSVMAEGKLHQITIKDEIAASQLKKLHSNELNAVLGGMGMVNRFLATVNTALNPEFVITNLERDLSTAGINLAGEHSAKMAAQVMRDVPKAIKGIFKAEFNKGENEWSKLYKELELEGGTIGFFGLEDIQTKVKGIESLLTQDDTYLGKSKKTLVAVKDAVMKANASVENASRLAAYKAALDKGMSKKQAASLAKNLTVNFNRRGETAPILNAAYLFANASIQGSARIFTALKHKRVRKIVTGIAATSFALAMYNQEAGGEDEDGVSHWEKISDYVKQTNLIIMLPDGSGKFIKIKLPYGYNAFWYSGVATHDLIAGKNTTTAGQSLKMLTTVVNAFNPIQGADLLDTVTPTILKPVEQDARNINFMMTPIRPDNPFDRYDRPDSDKSFNNTNQTLKDMAKFLNETTGGTDTKAGLIDVSPETIKHYTGWLTGGAGMTVYRAIGTGIKAATGQPIKLKEVPFARTLGSKVGTHYDTEKFYEAIRDVESVKAQVKVYRQNKDPRSGKYYSDNWKMLSLNKPISIHKKRIKALRLRKNTALRNRDYDGAEKLKQDIAKDMRLFLRRYNSAKNKV